MSTLQSKFASRSAQVIVTIFVFAIIIGFIFTFGSNPGRNFAQKESDVADVDGNPISLRQFQVVLSQRVKQFSQFMGGKDLTQKQIEQFGIATSTLKMLIEQKLLVNFAQEMGIEVSDKEVKDEILKLPYFQTNNRFDVNLYKGLLRQNSLTPQQFENDIRQDLIGRKIAPYISQRPISEGYAKSLIEIKENSVVVDAIKIEKNSLRDLIKVSSKEINDFVSKKENQGLLKVMYDSQKEKYQKPEQVKAYHILYKDTDKKSLEKLKKLKLTLTPKTFKKIAGKETQDPSGKNNQGSLGWFPKGRMVPEFDKVVFSMKKGQISNPVKTQFGYHIIYLEDKKPATKVKFESVKKELAEQSIKKRKTKELDKVFENKISEVKNLLKNNKTKQLKNLEAQFGFKLADNAKVNPLEGRASFISLTDEQTSDVFNNQKQEILEYKDAGSALLIAKRGKAKQANSGKIKEKLESEISQEEQKFGTQTRTKLLAKLAEKASISCTPGFSQVSYCE